MIRLNKQRPIQSFTEFVSKDKPTQWEQLPAKISAESRLHILCNEQDCICGYSEIPLEEDSSSSHIDHYYKRSLFPEKTFDWNNLIVSTTDEDFGGKHKDNKYKIKAKDYQLIFNPVVEDMSQYIEFLGNGEIVPLKGMPDIIINKVKKTVEVFNLNCRSLKNRRKYLMSQLESCKDLPKDDIKEAFAANGFVSVLNWFLKVIK
ncbi:MAG: TIGR02646 family protein [Bacteroidales bacterium]|nr:TIGR02646 family protein [Bacteroidales bacterium]